MNKQIIISFLSFTLLSGCADGFSSYFKRSANNKLFDTKGFQGGKRAPLYNKKYIAKAKKNVLEENFDDDDYNDDEDDYLESVDPAKLNRLMYLDMVKNDAKRRKNARLADVPQIQNDKNNKYPSLSKANNIASQNNNNEQQLQQELTEIKAMLRDTKKDLAKYKCPMEKSSTAKSPTQ